MKKLIVIIILFIGALIITGAIVGYKLFSSVASSKTNPVHSITSPISSSFSTPKKTPAKSPTQAITPSPTLNSKQKVAYLTFDDGPSNLTPNLLNILKNNNVKATFFVVGLQAEKYPDTLAQIANNGNVIGVHSWTHNYSYIYKSTQNFLSDFNKLKDYIYQATGIMPNVCRFPGGTNNTVYRNYTQDHIMSQIVTLVHNQGFEYFDWNVSSGEASAVPPPKDTIVNSVISQCKNKNTVVILFHDMDNQGYLDAIPEIITQLRSMGYSFQTLSPSNPPKSRLSGIQFKPQ